MFKKITALLMTFALLLGICSCGNSSKYDQYLPLLQKLAKSIETNDQQMYRETTNENFLKFTYDAVYANSYDEFEDFVAKEVNPNCLYIRLVDRFGEGFTIDVKINRVKKSRDTSFINTKNNRYHLESPITAMYEVFFTVTVNGTNGHESVSAKSSMTILEAGGDYFTEMPKALIYNQNTQKKGIIDPIEIGELTDI
jgi:hypothetical protein